MCAVELLPADLVAAVAFDGAPGSGHQGRDAALVRRAVELAPALRGQLLSLPGADIPWGGFLAIDPGSREIVGTCGFRGLSVAGPAREISYFTFPAFEGRGYASAMARALVEIAWSDPAVDLVCAHTQPRPGASTRVLTRLGMRRTGQVVDPEEGLLWRWELARASGAPAGR